MRPTTRESWETQSLQDTASYHQKFYSQGIAYSLMHFRISCPMNSGEELDDDEGQEEKCNCLIAFDDIEIYCDEYELGWGTRVL